MASDDTLSESNSFLLEFRTLISVSAYITPIRAKESLFARGSSRALVTLIVLVVIAAAALAYGSYLVQSRQTSLSEQSASSSQLMSEISEQERSTLIILNATYTPTNATYYLKVQNTENYTVSAQLSALIGAGVCPGNETAQSSFLSSDYAFAPRATAELSLNVGTASSATVCGTAVAPGQVNLEFILNNGTAVSPSYTFYFNT